MPELTHRIEAREGATGFLFVVAYAALSLAAIALVGPYGWDDGAITVAYAQTLGRHGIFALTPVSASAEGTSSLLMTAMLAIGQWLLHPGFLEAIRAAQLLSFIALSATLVLVWRALQPSLPNSTHRLIVVCLLGLLPACQAEIVNGMEMTLFALLLFAFVLFWRAQSTLAYALLPLLLLVRFEAVFYLGFALGWMVLFCRQDRPRALRMCVWLALCFLLLTIWRYWFFGALLPNTILAKLQPPYSKKGWDGILEKLRGLKDFLFVNAALLIGMYLSRKDAQERRPDPMPVLLILAFGVFALISGRNWGYTGRMFVAVLPVFVLALAERFATMRRPRVLRGLLLCLAGTFLFNMAVLRQNIDTIILGAAMRGVLPASLNAAADAARNRAWHESPGDWRGVTPQNFAMTGTSVDHLRAYLGQPTLKFMTPDVGGAGLCCEHLEILDSGLLTNPSLARRGYAALAGYLNEERPEVIETHGIWSRDSGIYSLAEFETNYLPAVFDGTLFWLRHDVLQRLVARGMAADSVRPENLRDVRYLGDSHDVSHLTRFSAVTVLSR
ncbi:hypothetical protein NOV72_03228 [Caballeronia novacaledonica]|uniref:Glycosyltransferase RgtA/B/C/D-like domain-containing protein n=1 Tax=Caballeronia novacaledonica TaxID=1544861 RepID=A0A2U3I773_9BURK|nr:hypothetical protein [Caballeronia novacaledonica]SPB16030.1 hypothetical protein NOV72_03228 [Caballeronia novacaledonica]